MSEYISRKHLGLDDLHSLCCLVKFSGSFFYFFPCITLFVVFTSTNMVNKDEYIITIAFWSTWSDDQQYQNLDAQNSLCCFDSCNKPI